jgi:hypothetical protein
MICAHCADAADRRVSHEGCPGRTWCDCQHLPLPALVPADAVPALLTPGEYVTPRLVEEPAT